MEYNFQLKSYTVNLIWTYRKSFRRAMRARVTCADVRNSYNTCSKAKYI